MRCAHLAVAASFPNDNPDIKPGWYLDLLHVGPDVGYPPNKVDSEIAQTAQMMQSVVTRPKKGQMGEGTSSDTISWPVLLARVKHGLFSRVKHGPARPVFPFSRDVTRI